MTIQNNIENFKIAQEKVKSHCMCAIYEPGLVIFPEGHFPQGIRFENTAKGHEQALQIMERTWIESFP